MKTRRLHLSALTIAMAFGLGGCMSLNPYKFSEKLDTVAVKRVMGDSRVGALAGDLDLALEALMHQRRLLWEGAGESETMKNMTALALVGLTSQAIYKGLADELPKRWLQRAGLGSAALYSGGQWLEPTKRQQVNVAGATALTCLALTSAPYEMPLEDFKHAKTQLNAARAALEEVFSLLHTMGATGARDSHESRVVSGAWRKAKFADDVLTATEHALGSIEQAGPRLRDMTALLTGETAKQTLAFSRDLVSLPDVLKTLRPNATLFAGGADIFKLPTPDGEAAAPAAADDTPTPGEAKKPLACKAPAAPASSNAPTGAAAAPAPTPAQVLAAQAAASAAKASAAEAKKDADRADAAALRAAAGANDAQVSRKAKLDKLDAALLKMSAPLGESISLVRRLNEARSKQQLPAACGGEDAGPVRLVPDVDQLILYAGQTFQFVLEGDDGRASAQFVGDAVPSSVLSVMQLADTRTTTLRLTAGAAVPANLQTTLRVSDSKSRISRSVSVQLCKGG